MLDIELYWTWKLDQKVSIDDNVSRTYRRTAKCKMMIAEASVTVFDGPSVLSRTVNGHSYCSVVKLTSTHLCDQGVIICCGSTILEIVLILVGLVLVVLSVLVPI